MYFAQNPDVTERNVQWKSTKTFKSDDEGDPEAEVVGETNAVVKTLRETVRSRLVLKIKHIVFYTQVGKERSREFRADVIRDDVELDDERVENLDENNDGKVKKEDENEDWTSGFRFGNNLKR